MVTEEDRWLDRFRELVERRRRDLGIQFYSELDKRAGFPKKLSTFSDILRGRRTIHGPDWIPIAKALDMPVEAMFAYLSGSVLRFPTLEVGPSDFALPSLPVTGEIDPEGWKPVPSPGEIIPEDMSDRDIPADPRYPFQQQYALLNRGNSIDRTARDGDYLIVWNHNATGQVLKSGELVIVTRLRPIAGTKLESREITARRFSVEGNKEYYSFDSDQKRYTDPDHDRYLPPLCRRVGEDVTTTGEHIAVIAKVVSVFRRVSPEP